MSSLERELYHCLKHWLPRIRAARDYELWTHSWNATRANIAGLEIMLERSQRALTDYEQQKAKAKPMLAEAMQEVEMCKEKKNVRQLLEENNKLLNDILMCLKKIIDDLK